MINLPNGCYISEMRIAPKNLDIKKDWIIYYSFYDPDFPKPKSRQIRGGKIGINKFKTISDRKRECKKLMELELEFLMNGFNPFYNQIIKDCSELSPNTSFIQALNKASEKIKIGKKSLVDIKSTIKGISLSARQLGIENKPISEVSRKYFKMIFEKCYENNPRFTDNRQNVYRKWLKIIYDELIEMEAVETNPLILIKKLKTVTKERRIPTQEERDLINNFLKTKYYYFWRAVQIFFMSGSREIELMAVKKSDVDLQNQRCKYTIKKRKQEEIVWRPITYAALPLWQEIYNEAREGDYLFSYDLKPGTHLLLTEALSKRWKRHIKEGLKLNIDLYTLKHLNTTELMDKLDKEYNPVPDVAGLTSHKSEAMIVKIYDVKNKDRKNEKVKRIGGTF
jgi:integrase